VVIEMQIDFVRDESGFQALAPVWNELLVRSCTDVPFLRFEYLRTWWETLGGGEWPGGELWLAVGRTGAQAIQAIAPFFSPAGEDTTRLLLLGSIEISDYLDILAPAEHVRTFTGAVLESLDREGPNGLQAIDLFNLPGESPSLQAWQEAGQARGWQVQRERLQPCPVIRLEGDWESYLARLDKKQRHELRRKMRRAQEHDPAITLRMVDSGADSESAMETFLGLMAADPTKQVFLTPRMREHFRRLASPPHRTPGLQFAFLDVGGQAAAGYLNFDYRNRLWAYNSCLNPAFASLSPGWVLVGRLIQWAIERGRSEFDFLRGGEDYKFRLGGEERSIYRLTLSR
jgi:CelD/BcsL family acetyltransferase involved in cellulose biosynthesis